MPVFEIQGPDGRTYELDAPDEKSALAAFGEIGAQPKAEGPKTGALAAGGLGALDGASFSFADELGAGLGAVSEKIGSYITGEKPRSYSDLRQAMLAQNEKAQEDAPGSYLAGQVAGGAAAGLGAAGGGLSMAANAARAGGGLGRVAAASAADGAIMGGAAGAGSGEGFNGRLGGAAGGALMGGGVGLAAPVAIAGATGAAKPLTAVLMSRIRPETYANTALATNLRRSGRSVDDIVEMLSAARADGQDMFNVGDAMGHAGERLFSTIARTPNDSRQMLVETLMGRQSGQGERLANTLAEGFASPDTAAQRAAKLTAARTSEANDLYARARNSAGAVNVTPVLKEIDETLSPGISAIARPQDKIAPDTIEGALARVRSMLSDGKSNLTDFNSLFRVKLDLDDMIARSDAQGAGNRAHALSRVQKLVDGALAEASPDYAKARDAFAAASRRIEAVDAGTSAASGRTRAQDNIAAFDAMPADQQAAFRAGYVDPLIARVEAGAMSPTTNKARGLITEKTGAEFPAFAAPGSAEQMGNRIAREDRMFRTANAALGGSKTADNLADQADLAQFDPTIIKTLVREGPMAAAMATVGRALAEAQGMPPSVVERIARTLMETDPAAARGLLQKGVTKQTRDDAVRGLATMLTTTIGSSAAGRLAAP